MRFLVSEKPLYVFKTAAEDDGCTQVGLQRSEEGGNKWVNTDGSSASFLTSRWAMGMPNNAAGAENCVQALAVPGSGCAPSSLPPPSRTFRLDSSPP